MRSVDISDSAIRDTVCSMKDKEMYQKERFEQTAKEFGADLDGAKPVGWVVPTHQMRLGRRNGGFTEPTLRR